MISSQTANIDGVELHYLTAGNGASLILIHGYAETSRMWKPIIPALAERFTVVAPYLPGIGDSSIPADGLDMTTAATRIHALVASLGLQNAEVVGHDIGLMVAYAYAAKFPADVKKLVLMDAFLPGVDGWKDIYDHPGIWHFRFHGPTPETLVLGRERIYFEHFWNDFAADKVYSIPEADRQAYTKAYARPGRMRAGWAYFASFQKAAEDFASIRTDQTFDADPGHRRRKSQRRSSGPASQTGRLGCNGRRTQKRRPLAHGRTAARNQPSAAQVSLKVAHDLADEPRAVPSNRSKSPSIELAEATPLE